VGFEAAAQLAEAGWGNVILACRTEEKAEAARVLLVARTGKNPFSALAVDTSEVASANAASDRLRENGAVVDLLLLNAGATASQAQFNSDGVEITWASGLVGHHVMTMRLLSDGLLSESAHIVMAGSEGSRGNVPGMKVHDFVKVANDQFGGNRVAAVEALARIQAQGKYKSTQEYVSAKVVAAWWAAAMARRLPVGMTVNAVSPGSALVSNFGRNQPWVARRLMMPLMKIVGPLMGMAGSIESAARRYVVAADLTYADTGKFYATAHRNKLVGPIGVQTWPEYLTDEVSQEAGFAAVENLTKTRFPALVRTAATVCGFPPPPPQARWHEARRTCGDVGQ
jgi:NAD(P)-dependent dehydrogenase (short-subunit alcohol dehydrogenase family)